MHRITKRQLRDALNAETDTVLADFFGITLSAVSQWSEDEPIPERRMLQVALRRPDITERFQAEGAEPPKQEAA